MVDDGRTGIPVTAPDLRDWGTAAGEMWAAARVNLAHEWRGVRRDVRPAGAGQVAILSGRSPYVSSLLLRLDDLDDLPPSGALVAAPHRETLLVAPLPSTSVAAGVRADLADLAASLYGSGRAAPVSRRVFWWRLGAPLLPAESAEAAEAGEGTPRYTS